MSKSKSPKIYAECCVEASLRADFCKMFIEMFSNFVGVMENKISKLQFMDFEKLTDHKFEINRRCLVLRKYSNC